MFLNCCNVVRKSNICLSLYYGLMALFYQSLNKFYLKYLNFYAFQFLEFAVKTRTTNFIILFANEIKKNITYHIREDFFKV